LTSFILVQFLHNLSNQFFFKNLILVRFKGIEANDLYVYKIYFLKKSIIPFLEGTKEKFENF